MSGGLAPVATLPAHTVDLFLGGRIALMQPVKGHRAGLDAALLQAVVPGDASGLLVDLGAGVGTVAFSAAARAADLTAVAAERDPALVALAEAALRLPANAGFAGRVRIAAADVTEPVGMRRLLGGRQADWLLMNPPFDTPGRVRASPNAGRRSAHVGEVGLLEAWCATAAALLRPGGTLGIIHRAEALPEVIRTLASAFGGTCVLPTHPSKDAAATRVVVWAERAGRDPVRMLPGLVLHQPGGAWTEAADAVLRGRTSLSFA